MKLVKDIFKTKEGMYVWNSFSERFNDEPLGKESGALATYMLPRTMTDTEILKEIGNKYCTFADIAKAIKEEKQIFKNGYTNLFYVKKGEKVFAVSVDWLSDNRKWYVDGWGLGGDGDWDADRRVLCPGNADSEKLISEPLDPQKFGHLEKRVESLEQDMEKIKKFLII